MTDVTRLVDYQLPLFVAEGQLTSAVLADPRCYELVRWLDPDLFRWPITRQVYVSIQWVLRDHPLIDAGELETRVKDVLIAYRKPDALSLLVQMHGVPSGTPSNVNLYAVEIFEARRHEDMRSAAAKIMQVTVNDEMELWQKRELFDEVYRELVSASNDEPGWHPAEGLTTVSEFMAAGDVRHEWVIPGLLERQERLMCIAPEKAGKTVLTRQVALMLAAGRHPLSLATPVPVMRTLLVDLENPAASARRDFRRQVDTLVDVWSNDNDNAFILHRPAGMHLGDHADRMTLTQAVDRLSIDLLCISPIYKAYDRLGDSWEEQAFGVQKPLDMLRERYNCAIWMEHHPPGKVAGSVREIRPIGSSRWSRWLDYQMALVPEIGDHPPYQTLWWNSVSRDEAKISPQRIIRGGIGEPSWLPKWEDSQYGFDLALHEAEL